MFSACVSANGIIYNPNFREQSKNVFDFNENSQYYVKTKLGYVTDIVLMSGEFVQKIASGDTERWIVDTDSVNGIEHIYIKPLMEDIQTNMIINTNIRSYRIIVSEISSSNNYDFIISFENPNKAMIEQNEKMRIKNEKFEKEHKEYLEKTREKWTAKFFQNYKVKKQKNVFDENLPLKIFSTKTKTYIQISQSNLNNMPTIYYYDDYDKKKLHLVNFRLKGNLIEVDRTMNQFRILFSQKSYVDIERTNEKTSNFSNEVLLELLEKAENEQLENKESHEEDLIFYQKEIDEKEKERLERIKQERLSNTTTNSTKDEDLTEEFVSEE